MEIPVSSDVLGLSCTTASVAVFTFESSSPPVSSLELSVDGIGNTWEGYQPGGRFYEEARDATHCNRYGIELTPLYALRHLPLRIDPVMTVRPSPTQEASYPSLDIPAHDVTVLEPTFRIPTP